MHKFFLLNLKISGIKNIEKPIEIPFYKKTIKNDFNPDQYRVKGIYGENGSGKTAILTAVNILTKIIYQNNYLPDSVNQMLFLENINKKTNNGFIEVEFFAQEEQEEDYIYLYRVEFQVNKNDRVFLSRELFQRKNGHNSQTKYVTLYEVTDGSLDTLIYPELFDYCDENSKNLLWQTSFAALAFRFIHRDDINALKLFNHMRVLFSFATGIHVDIDGEDDHRSYAYKALQGKTAEGIMKESSYGDQYLWYASAPKDGKEVIVPHFWMNGYEEQIKRLLSFVRIFKPELKDIKLDKKDHGNYYVCRRIMIYEDYELDEEYESRGIRKLMSLFDALDMACKGSIVFIDELDSNINDVYLNKLIEYIIYYGKGQLCFTAHNLSPMSVLRSSKCAISFISSVNTVHTWTSNGNLNPANAYRDGFIEDSPFNVDASDFLGILGGIDD